MIQALIGVHGIKRAKRARFLIRSAINAPIDARLMHKPGAHNARLQRHIHGTSRQSPHAQLLRGSLHGQKFRMPRRILRCLAQVARARNDARFGEQRPTRSLVDGVIHHHRTNGHLVQAGPRRASSIASRM